MAKKDHKGIASDLVKELIENAPIPPMQQTNGNIIKPMKEQTDKFTVEIESNLMQQVRLHSVNRKIKLRPLFEAALKEYLTAHTSE